MAKGRKFSMVSPALWRSKRFKSVSEGAQLLHLYYITNHHQTLAGVHQIPEGYALTDLNWSKETYRQARDELIQAGLIIFDDETEEVFVCRWFVHNEPASTKHIKGMHSVVDDIVSRSIQDHVRQELDAIEAKKISDRADNRGYDG